MDSEETDRLLVKLRGTLVQWQDALSGKFFMEKPEVVFGAERDLNLRVYQEEAALVDHWFESIGVDISGDKYGGWRQDCLFENNKFNLQFYHELTEDKEHGLYFKIVPETWPCCFYDTCPGGTCYGPTEAVPC